MTKVDAVIVEKGPGWTHYYYEKCDKCGELTDPVLLRLADSDGKEILAGDLIECPGEPDNGAWRYHAVFKNSHGRLEIRDLGHNNVHMYDLQGRFITIGPYWKHLDKLSDEDLEHYWDTNRADAEAKATEGGG